MKTNIKPKPLFLNTLMAVAWRIRWAGLTLTVCLLGSGLTAQAHDPYLTNTNHPVDTNVSLGATVRFQIAASTTNGPLTFRWQHAGTNLPTATNNSLVISNVTVAHAGGYMAWATNASASFTNTRTAILTVDPTFTKVMTGVVVNDAEGSLSGNWFYPDNTGFPSPLVINSDLNTGVRNTLYRNTYGTNFIRVATSPFTTDLMRAWAAAGADYDNDGNVDFVVANLDGGSLAQRLYRNLGSWSFTAVVDPGLRSDVARATCPWWIDIDNDGFLDLFMAKGMFLGGAANDCLFRNNRDGTFKKMTAAEVGPLVSDQKQTIFCYSADIDNDGRQELSVVYEIPLSSSLSFATNATWRCQGDGTFVPIMTTGMPNSFPWRWWADYNNDGRLDAFSQDTNALPALFQNLGAAGFTNVTTALNMTKTMKVNWVAWGDYDNDGWLDLFYTGAYWDSAATPNGFFHNNGDGTFTQILTGSPVADLGRRAAPSWVDYDNDGFLDLFIAVGDAKPEKNLLYRNNGNSNHWLKVRLDGRASNRSGIGAKIKVQATIKGQTVEQMREISCENAFAGQNGLLAHFGLGDATNVTKLTIEWPSGIVQDLTNVVANQFLTVVECQNYGGPCPCFDGATNHPSGLQLSLTEPSAGIRYFIEASTDLVHWTKLMARTSAGGTHQFTDTGRTNYPNRYYRIQVP